MRLSEVEAMCWLFGVSRRGQLIYNYMRHVCDMCRPYWVQAFA